MSDPQEAGSGSQLRLARQARGYSQQQLAGMGGVTRQAVSAVESGLSDPSLRAALGLAQALGMTVEELFGPLTPAPAVTARPVAPLGDNGGRVTLAPVGDGFVALPLWGATASRAGFLPAGGLASQAGGAPGAAFQVRPIGPPRPTLVAAGCDPALPLLEGPLGLLDPPIALSWWPCSSRESLGRLDGSGYHRGLVTAASCRSHPAATPSARVPRRRAPRLHPGAPWGFLAQSYGSAEAVSLWPRLTSCRLGRRPVSIRLTLVADQGQLVGNLFMGEVLVVAKLPQAHAEPTEITRLGWTPLKKHRHPSQLKGVTLDSSRHPASPQWRCTFATVYGPSSYSMDVRPLTVQRCLIRVGRFLAILPVGALVDLYGYDQPVELGWLTER